MRSILVLFSILIVSISAKGQVDFTARPVADHLNIPWDLLEGPDGKIWFTERVGLVSRIHPDTKEKDTILDFRESVANSVEIGLLGMVLHPNFSEQPYVYAAYAFKDYDTWVKRVLRGRFDGSKIVDITNIYELKPAQQWHQGCRLIILPDTTLMFTNGDQPAPDSTFSLTSEIGKTIRINLDGSIPADNPFPGSKIWSIGHRNPQGMCRLPNGNIFASEHGDRIEDEINLIIKGANYGWPKIEGRCDLPSEIDFCTANNVVEPVWSSGTQLTYAPSGLEYYPHTRYPALTGKLLGVFLKASRMMAFTLSEDQSTITKTDHMLMFRYGRLRDVLVMSDGRLFVCTGNYDARNIAPFPKPDHDVIVELLPVWEYEEPKVRVPLDTIVYRADAGDTVKTAVEFCSDGGTPVNYNRFATNPGNIFEARFWQDGASTEGTDCYLFRVQYTPQTDFPYVSTATVFYANPGEEEHSQYATLIGLPKKGYVRSTQDTFMVSAGSTVQCSVRNIGLDTVTVTSALFSPSGSATADPLEYPVMVAPDEVQTLTFTITPPIMPGKVIDVVLLTDAFRDATFSIKLLPVSVEEEERGPRFGLAPQPVKDALYITLEDGATHMITVHDVLGRPVYSAEHSGTSVSIPIMSFSSTASNGVYTLSVSARGHTRTTPFLLAP